VVAASVQAKLGGENVTAARLAGQQPWLIVVRQSAETRQVTTDWRARDVRAGTLFNIRSIADPDAGRTWFEILCQSGVAT
jgi:head-tail adaptor